ncbi:MarR family winged helix-turn-helix transcriptional regulator [Kitasatospora azatica]|uniref:MarR family winged helix-turn-helix transcriptional regulator n=1 Tax=Kitasatospora azatica TaxID=58347 RepID=UPI00055F4A6D|nr:MarR family transcriptional regulator [Kitasatospora azatica]
MKGKPRPQATPEQAQYAMDRMIALAQFGQQDIAARLGLNVTDLTCLGFVVETALAGEPLAAGDLAERAQLTTGAVTGVLNRLEKAGYAHREVDPGDRRRVRVVMADDAQARILQVYGPFYARIGALFADYTPDEIAVIADWFTRAKAALDQSLDEIRNNKR